MDSDVKLHDGMAEIVGDKVRTDVGFDGGVIELNGSNLKTTVSNVEMLYYGGHLTAKDGNVELGSTDSGTLVGIRQSRDGNIKLTSSWRDGTIEVAGKNFKTSVTNMEMYYYGGHLTTKDGNVELGSIDSGKFVGFRQPKGAGVSLHGPVTVTDALTVKSLQILLEPEQFAVSFDGGTEVEGTNDIPGVIDISHSGGPMRPPVASIAIDVLQIIMGLLDRVDKLEIEVAALRA